MSGDEKNTQKEKKNNILPLWGNERSMNLNPLILTNIQSSHYFKVNLYELKTYHEVIDEIYYKVTHMEPWEKGSRKTAGQTGMCGGVRGVGAGGIVSTAYCLLYKLFTLKLTRKQVNGLLTHPDSPYIRALGFMYIRYTQPPADLWDWYDEYLEDPEEMDVKAGGGQVMKLGDILKHFLTKLEWFSTLFPRIPVPIQQKLERQLGARFPAIAAPVPVPPVVAPPVQQRPRGGHRGEEEPGFGEAERVAKLRRADTEGRSPSSGRSPRDSPSHRGEKRSRPSSPTVSSRKHHRPHEESPPRSRHHDISPSRARHRHDDRVRHEDHGRDRYEREREVEPRYEREEHSSRYDDRQVDRHERKKDRSNGHGSSKSHHRSHRNEEHSSRRSERSSKDFASELMREKERQRKDKSRSSPVRS